MLTKLAPQRIRGLSFPELLVAIFLFGLITTAIATLTRTGLNYIGRAENKAELQRSSLFALNRISREVAESHRDAIKLSTTPSGLVYASPRGDNGVTYHNGLVQWRRLVAVYLDKNSKLLLALTENLSSPNTFTPDLGPNGLNRSVDTMISEAGASLRTSVLTRNATEFSVTSTNNLRSLDLTLTVSVGRDSHQSTLRTQTTCVPNQ